MAQAEKEADTEEYERFEKMHSPFTREETDDGRYLVTPEIEDGYGWVFEDDDVLAVEKLDGENIAVYIDENGEVGDIYTREGNPVEPFGDPQYSYIVKGVIESYNRGWLESLESGELHYGELLGPQSQGNKYDLDEHVWVPFSYAQENFAYESWGKYPTDYETISGWFEESLIPLFAARAHNLSFDETGDEYVEGIIFTHPDGRMAKLRRNMFDWYSGE
ncbi:RNA ligase family protein [Halorubrum ezzemoulense]|uniref:RNA ligase family protein n=1 Tax=Halorubrum ezzemoulense TaxID=337243 RepID=UPI00232F902D|nr:RNA ligase family protein [Halorubrum ezzemoulense]MDB2237065.1 RNA ligase family protein [Halorubrum ezzemoulense]